MDKPSTYMIKTKSYISKQFKEPQEKEIWHSIIKLLENTVKEKRKKTSKEREEKNTLHKKKKIKRDQQQISKTMQGKRQCKAVFKVLEGKKSYTDDR